MCIEPQDASLDFWDWHSIATTVNLVKLYYQRALFWETGVWHLQWFPPCLAWLSYMLTWSIGKAVNGSARVYYWPALSVPSPELTERTNLSPGSFKAPACRQGYKTSCRIVDGCLVPLRLLQNTAHNALFRPESHSDAMLLSIMKQAGKKQDPLALNDIAMPVSTWPLSIQE